MNKRDTSVLQRMHDLEMSIKGFKSPQPVGTDSVRTYTTYTNDEWDITWVATSDGFSAWNRWRVKFKADHQDAPFGRIRAIADFNGVKYDFSTRSSDYLDDNYVRVGDDFLGGGLSPTSDNSEFEDPQLLRFIVEASAVAAGVVLRMKFFVDATDTGRIYFSEGQNP